MRSAASMTTIPELARRSTRLLIGACLAGLVAGCEPAPLEPGEAAARSIVGPAGDGGDAAAGAVWQAALEAWPKEGNLSVLYGAPHVQGRMDAWMMGQMPPQPLPEVGKPVMEKVRAFNDRLIALDGAWGAVPEPSKVRAMAVRGIRKTLWADARLAVAEEDADRLADILVVMATLPRVSHTYDASVRGLVATLGLVDGLTWALRDATTDRFEVELDPAACERLADAIAWAEAEAPFGVAEEQDPQRAKAIDGFERDTRVRLREMLAANCP